MDASDGQQILHKRSVDDLNNNDEHWLWAPVNRIKRSLHNVLGTGDNHLTKRIKRFAWPWEVPEEKSETEESTPENLRNSFEDEDVDIDVDVDGSGSNDINRATDMFGAKLEKFCK